MRRKILWLAPLGLSLITLAAGFAWLFATESGLHWSYARLRVAVPGTLDVDTVEGRLMGPLRLRGVRYRHPSLDAHIQSIELDWSPLALLAWRLKIKELSVGDAQLAFRPSATKSESGPLTLKPPLPVRVESFTAKNVQLQRADQAPYNFQTLDFSGRLDADNLQVDRFELLMPQLQATAQGALNLANDNGRLRIDVRAQPGSLPALVAYAELSGNLSKLTVDAGTSAPLKATLRGEIENTLTKPTWQAELQIPEFNFEQLQAKMAGAAALQLQARGDTARFESHGTLQARYDGIPNITGAFRMHGSTTGDLTLDELAVTMPGSPARLTASGNWRSGDGVFRANVRWQELRWPLTGAPLVVSPTGQAEVNGKPSDYRFTLAARTQGEKIPAATWRASGNGDSTRALVQTLALETLDTTLQGNASLAWAPRLAWDVRLEGSGLNPGAVWRAWPGKLAVSAQAAGDGEEIRVELARLSGDLRGRTVNARATLVRRGVDYPAVALNLQSGNARVDVTGAVRKDWKLSWQIAAPDLAALWPDARGNLRGSGSVSGARAAPTVRAQVTGNNISLDEFSAATLNADVDVDTSDRQRSRAHLGLAEAIWSQRQIQQLAIDADGFVSEHTLAVNAHTLDGAVQLTFSGGYRDATWRGSLRASQWQIGSDKWSLAEAAQMLVGPAQLTLAPACWTSAEAARLCVRFRRTADGDAQGGLTAARVPLALLAPLLTQPIELQGRFDGAADVDLRANRLRGAQARFTANGGSIRWATASAGTVLAYQNAAMELHVDDNGLRSHAELEFAGGDRGYADVALPGFNTAHPAGGAQPLLGKINFAVRDLAPFAALLPEVEQLRGALRVELSLQGTLADPQVRGDARLTNGSARIPGLGIQVQDVRLIASPDGHDLRLNGYARSGDGELGLSGRLTFGTKPAWRAELRIAGAEFEALNISEARVSVTPDLRVQLDPGKVSVRGELLIPRARFAPRPKRATVKPSQDVVIEGPTDDVSARASAWEVTTEIKVTLGDNVEFEGFGLSGRIKGSITLIETPGQVTTARGELTINNGRYEAYGQKLEIEVGRLLYAGGPVDDPGIDARAVRRVGEITAGVQVKGTLKAPELTLFSDPPMGQSDQLSYLLFGKPVDTANAGQAAALAAAARALKLSGGEFLAQRLAARFGIEEVEIQNVPTSTGTQDAALVLGKRLSPRLYINYSIGLFEPVNVFRVRYELTTHWILQAETGTYRGADVLYTIER